METETREKTAEAPQVELREARVAGQDVAMARQSAPIEQGDFDPRFLRDALEAAQYMAQAGPAVPPHCQNQPGVCFGVIMRALNWRAEPFGVANKSYVVKAKDGSLRLAWEASLIHAVVVRHGNLVGELLTEYLGEGADQQIKVTGTYLVNGVRVTREYESPKLSKIAVKNSPLWAADLQQQFHYYGTRAWARRWRPGVILGIFTPDEIRHGEVDEIDEAERAQLIAAKGDVLGEDVLRDPDAPLPTAPLAHRFSYELEKVPSNPTQVPALQRIFLGFQAEIELTDEKSRTTLRGIFELHLRRLRGDISHDEAMAVSRQHRAPDGER
jgi:hypothetical protein